MTVFLDPYQNNTGGYKALCVSLSMFSYIYLGWSLGRLVKRSGNTVPIFRW